MPALISQPSTLPPVMRRALVVLACCLLFAALYAAPAAARGQARAFSTPFSYYADSQELNAVLLSFARAQGLRGTVSAGLTGRVSGRFDAVPPEQFLGGMRSAFGVAWYRIGDTMHFYNEAESTRAFITPRSMGAEQLLGLLRRSAVFSPQLPPTLGGQEGLIALSGPPDYIAQVTAAANSYEEIQGSRLVMQVFPLNYAWAEDMTVNNMDKTVTVPGVASILRAMVSGSPLSARQVTQQPASVGKLAGTGLAALGKEDSPQEQAGAAPAAAAAPMPAVNIMADSRVNAVIINDAAYRMPYYKQVIADLDKPVELVEIHAAIVDIDTELTRTLGVSYQGADRNAGNGWGAGGELAADTAKFSPMPVQGQPAAAGLSLSTIYTNGADYFLARVHALEKDGDARMLGRPSVLTVDNVQATLENTSSYYIQLAGYQAVDLFKVESGTVLRVTPHIIRDKFTGQATIKLAVSVQDDQKDQESTTSTTNSNIAIPPVKQTKINTQAIVGAGQSLLIGGYYYEQKSTTESGIPILMHIPVLGHLFKTTSKGSKRMERLILITPRILNLQEMAKNIPPRVDDPAFHQSPTQSDYAERVPVSHSGCGRSSTPAAPVSSTSQGANVTNAAETRVGAVNTAPQGMNAAPRPASAQP